MTANQNIRLIAANGSAGVFVLIRGSINSRKVTITEDGSSNGGAAQGIQYFVPDPFNAAQVQTQPGTFEMATPASEPIVLGGDGAFNGPYGQMVGNGPQEAPGAGVAPFLGTPLIWVRSASANAIAVRVMETA